MRVSTRLIGFYLAAIAVIPAAKLAAQAKDTTSKDTGVADSTSRPKVTPIIYSPYPSFGPNTTAYGAELSARGWIKEPARTAFAKLTEYKSIPNDALVRAFMVNHTAADSITVFQLNGANIGQLDQSLRFRGNSPGRYDLQLRWDRMPHTFSTNARSLGSEDTAGVFTLSNPRPDTTAWNNAPFIGPVRVKWSSVRSLAAVTPSPKWDLRAEYLNVQKSGRRPMGMAFGSPGSNFREILEPIQQSMQDLRFTESYANQTFQLMGAYDLSLFHNDFTSVTADNPLIAADLATTGSSRGRTALAPSNKAHTGMLNAAVNLPLHTRISASGTYSVWYQDEPFIPATINSKITDARIAQIPTSLGGHSGTSSVYLSGTSRPVMPVTLTARYRIFSWRDHVDVDSMPVMIVNDRSISAGAERESLPFTRRNADGGATYRWTKFIPVTLSAGLGWESWERSEARNVAHLREWTPRYSADFGFFDLMSLRASYTTGRRRIHGDYVQNTPNDLPLHRRFDQANRDRERTNLIATITPIDALTLSGTWGVGRDDYPDSPYGLQSDRSNVEEGDVTWEISDRFSVNGSVTHERFLTRLRSKYRTTGQLDNPTYDWVANNRDAVHTTSAGFRAVIIPNRFEAGGHIDASRAQFLMATFNPTTPTGGTATQNFNATASDLPLIKQKFQPMSLFATYLFQDWGITARYDAERWLQDDFRTNGLRPNESAVIFLGNNLENYNARYFSISVSYRPALLRFPRPAI